MVFTFIARTVPAILALGGVMGLVMGAGWAWPLIIIGGVLFVLTLRL